MTETTPPTTDPRMATDVPCGHAVTRPDGDGALFVKAERLCREHIQHYLIQLDPAPVEDMALIYIDPEDMLVDHQMRPVFVLSDGIESGAPDIGDIFINPKGAFLKVVEDPMSQKMFAFIDIATGDVLRRQERAVSHVHMEWSIK